MIVAALGLDGPVLVLLAAAGVLVTAALLALILREHSAAAEPRGAPTRSPGSPTTAVFTRRSAAELASARERGDTPALDRSSTSTTSSAINEAHGHPYGDEVLRGGRRGAAQAPSGTSTRRRGSAARSSR